MTQVNPDGYKGQWNMRNRTGDLGMAEPCPPLQSWVVINFAGNRMQVN